MKYQFRGGGEKHYYKSLFFCSALSVSNYMQVIQVTYPSHSYISNLHVLLFLPLLAITTICLYCLLMYMHISLSVRF